MELSTKNKKIKSKKFMELGEIKREVKEFFKITIFFETTIERGEQ
jgi:hypothetical protein